MSNCPHLHEHSKVCQSCGAGAQPSVQGLVAVSSPLRVTGETNRTAHSQQMRLKKSTKETNEAAYRFSVRIVGLGSIRVHWVSSSSLSLLLRLGGNLPLSSFCKGRGSAGCQTSLWEGQQPAPFPGLPHLILSGVLSFYLLQPWHGLQVQRGEATPGQSITLAPACRGGVSMSCHSA